MEHQLCTPDNGFYSTLPINVAGIEVKNNFLAPNEHVMLHKANLNPSVFIILGLKGNYEIIFKQSNQLVKAIGGYHNFFYSHDKDVYIHNKDARSEIFIIIFPDELFLQLAGNGGELLTQFADNIKKGNDIFLNDRWGTIDLSITQIIQELINCKHQGDLQKIFFISKCFELLVLCATSCCSARKQKEVYLKNLADQEKIIAVKDYINQRVHCPPHLNEIAKTVGLNVYKLKRGFKEVYNISVFKYLTEQRLNLAYQYLKETQKTAAEIAFQLGYATPQHFSYMFKKRFGITPHQVKVQV